MDETPETELRDLIYFDFAKAASLYSQVEGGLLQEMRVTSEDTQGSKSSGGLNFPFAKAEFGGDAQEKTSIYESRVLHHDLLTRLETWLRGGEQLRDLTELASQPDLSNERIRESIGTPSFVIAEGYAEFYDYDRFTRYASKLNDLNQFFSQATEEAAKKSPEYEQAMEQLQAMKSEAEAEKNPATKGMKRKAVRDAERALEALVRQTPNLVEEYLVKGLNLLTETMMPHRLNLRIFPFQRNPEFSILANLKRDCFVDADLENFMFAYGMLPNVLLTVFGLITDIPPKGGRVFHPADVLADLTNEQRQLEQGFRQVFKSLEQMEIHTRFSVYPSITLYPIAVYQRLGPRDEAQEIEA